MKEQLQLNFAREIERDRTQEWALDERRSRLATAVENNILVSFVGLILLQAIGVMLLVIFAFT